MSRRLSMLNAMRDAYAASGLELSKRHPQCRGKIRSATPEDADRQIATLLARPDEHPAKGERLGKYLCRWCGGWHIGHRPRSARPRRWRGQRNRMH